MIPWREKLLAFALHFLLTAVVALGAAALIFLLWFPDPFQVMVGGTQLFLLVVGCDLALGPLISLVIYDSRKTRAKLLLDYAIVGVLQLAALVYGVYVVSDSRPVYVVFVGDRLEVVTAGELAEADLQAALYPIYREKPRWGVRLVATLVPPENHNEVLFSGLAGKDVQRLPRYYVPYESQLQRIRARAAPLSSLERSDPAAKPLLDAAREELRLPEETLRWLPVRHPNGFWIALVDPEDGRPLRYLGIDPY